MIFRYTHCRCVKNFQLIPSFANLILLHYMVLDAYSAGITKTTMGDVDKHVLLLRGHLIIMREAKTSGDNFSSDINLYAT